jgi:hypothetical protein
MVENDKGFYASDNSEIQYVAPHLWDAAGLLNGRFDLAKLAQEQHPTYFLYSIGTKYEYANPAQYADRQDLGTDSPDSLRTFATFDPKFNIWMFRCQQETTATLTSAASYYPEMRDPAYLFGERVHVGDAYVDVDSIASAYQDVQFYINTQTQSTIVQTAEEIRKKFKRLKKEQ